MFLGFFCVVFKKFSLPSRAREQVRQEPLLGSEPGGEDSLYTHIHTHAGILTESEMNL